MQKTITFVTTNDGKFEEVKRWLHELEPSIELTQAAIDLPEIQSLNVEEVALAKAKEAWQIMQKPLIIDDGGIFLEKYNKFPGALSKWVYQGIGLDGIWLLAAEDPRAYFLSHLVYADSTGFYNFEAKFFGHVTKPTGKVTFRQLPYCDIFIPTGENKTLAQLRVENKDKQYNHRYNALIALVDWFNRKI